MFIRNINLILGISAMALAGCSGGGGDGGSLPTVPTEATAPPTPVTSASTTLGQQVGSVIASTDYANTIPAPSPTQFTLAGSNYYDGTYDFTIGTRDPNGPGYAALFNNGAASSYHLPGNINIWGHTVTGACSSGTNCIVGPRLLTPPADVVTAWQNGWTGKGINILINDDFNPNGNGWHPTTTGLIAGSYAMGANLYGLDFTNLNQVINLNGTNATPSSPISFGVINASFGADLPSLIGHAAPWTNAELNRAINEFASTAAVVVNTYNGRTTLPNFSFTDAVITKAAGNDSTDTFKMFASKEPMTAALLADASTAPRLIIVGALRGGAMTSYSQIAGTDTYGTGSLPVSSRFLVAEDATPFADGALAIDGTNIASTYNVGTSYAAPRVAGYAAILRQEFPRLNAAQTANILLDTASYVGLNYNGSSCSVTPVPAGCVSTYGRGQAKLGAAMAPVGNLR